MRITMLSIPGDEPDLFRLQIAFHRHVGVDVVLVPEGTYPDGIRSVIREQTKAGNIDTVSLGCEGEADLRTAASVSGARFGARWAMCALPGEFWLPRAASLKDLLSPVPPRYDIVQGLVRSFVHVTPAPTGAPWGVTVRRERVASGPLLRPMSRCASTPIGGPGQPLRGWYPVEVLRFPVGEAPVHRSDVESGLRSGALVVDSRLHDALSALSQGVGLQLSVPDVVADAEYACDCAKVGEVSLEKLEQHIQDLERRIIEIESGLGQRLRTAVRRFTQQLRR